MAIDHQENQPNIIFILLDALRARNLNCYGYPKPTSRYIDKMAEEGVLFENCFSCSNGTDPSLTTIFSGLYPLSHGVIKHNDMYENVKQSLANVRFLPQILNSHGYYTMSIDWLGRWHKLGYDYYSGISQKPNQFDSIFTKLGKFTYGHTKVYNFLKPLAQRVKRGKRYEDADNITRRASDLINANKEKKFFLFLHYWDTHTPYKPPAQYSSKFKDEKAPHSNIRSRYDGSIAYADYNIGILMEMLKKLDLLDDTLIIFTGDHGESLGEHEIYFAHHGLYDEGVHVPLIFRYPKLLPQGKRIDALIQHFDVFPTILDILAIPRNEENLDGKSLLPLVTGKISELHEAVYSIDSQNINGKRLIRTEDYKYTFAFSEEAAVCRVCGRMHGDLEELFDLKEDPNETRNILGENPKIAKQLKDKALAQEKNWVTKKQRTGIKRAIKNLKLQGSKNG
jgi:arylsulfatase A-like enzyme